HVRDGDILDARHRADRREVLARDDARIGFLTDAGDLEADDLVLGDAAIAIHPGSSLLDHEHRVAHDRARERDLEDDQDRRRAMPAQCTDDGNEIHVDPQCDLSWMAGVTWQPRHAGRSPASTLDTTASTNVAPSMTMSR